MSNDFNPEEYEDVHRAFVQAMLARGVLRSNEAFDLLREILEAFNYTLASETADQEKKLLRDQTGAVLIQINRKIRPFSMQIRRGMDEYTGGQVYILVNQQKSDESVSFFKDFSTKEMDYFKLMLNAMFGVESDSDDHSLGQIACFNLEGRPFSIKDAENFIKKMRQLKWVEEDENYNFRLTVRAIHELQPFLKQTFDLPVCKICTNCVILERKAIKCGDCDLFFHRACLSSRSGGRKCPNEDCGAHWPQDENAQSQGKKRMKLDNSDTDD